MIARRLCSSAQAARARVAAAAPPPPPPPPPQLLQPLTWRRWQSGPSLNTLQRPVQSYLSTSHDPYLNLSIEHYLLQKSPPESAVLFLYVNRPSIIIGRNQNPWLEVNLALLNVSRDQAETEPPGGLGAVDLVRRRSGGGTVFHDKGNVNWTVICPAADFTRDKHAEMVVRALRSCGVERARVNARHDVVLDQGKRGTRTDPNDTHSTPYEATDFDTPRPLKVSGSAYKLTRNRALHHGTCLLNSPNLHVIPDYLHSPAKPYITARGVESVSSPVGNILLRNEDFIKSVQEHFCQQYSHSPEVVKVGSEWLEDATVLQGHNELKSQEWTYLQTPQWSIDSKGEAIPDVKLAMSVRHGAIETASLETRGQGQVQVQVQDIREKLVGLKVHETSDWEQRMKPALHDTGLDVPKQAMLGRWLNKMLPSR